MNLFVLLAEETAAKAAPGVLERLARFPLVWAVVLSALAIFLLLPQGGRRRRWLGSSLGLVALGLFGWYGLSLGGWVEDLVFFVLAAVTVIAAAATVTSKSPVYSAIWFAMVLLGTAGLFLYQGAQFLGVATVVVYAGAILVTFLFVLMLAQPDGDAYYDRMSWEPLLSAVAGSVMVGLLTGAILQSTGTPLAIAEEVTEETAEASDPAAAVTEVTLDSEEGGPEVKLTLVPAKDEPALPEGAEEEALKAKGGVLTENHVATLGQMMFSRELIAVQVAGALLLAALVGAVAIVAQGKKLPQADPHTHEHGSSAHV